MTTREALLRAVIDNPEEDTPRLAFADLLDEIDNPADAARAELIRLQIAHRHTHVRDARYRAMRKRADELTKLYRVAWLPAVPAVNDYEPHYSRGFVEYWQFKSFTQFAFQEPSILDHEPVTDVYTYLNPEEIGRVVESPRLSRLRELNLRTGPCSDAALTEFFRGAQLTNLRRLTVYGDSAGPGFVNALGCLPQYVKLEELIIEGQPLGDGAMAALSNLLSRLKQLSLNFNGMTSNYGMLGRSPLIPRVQGLHISGNAPTQTAALELAEVLTNHLSTLERLGLERTAATDRVAERLAAACWPNLKRLALSAVSFGQPGIALDTPRITPTGLQALGNASFATSLESLDLRSNPIGDAGVPLLARFPRLRILKLERTGITAVGVRALLELPSASNLESLNLAQCPIGDDGATMIAEAEWPKLWMLELAHCGIGEAGGRAIRRSRTLPRDTEWFWLRHNPIPEVLIPALQEH